MSRLSRCLLQTQDEFFATSSGEENPGLAALGDIYLCVHSSNTPELVKAERLAGLEHCDAVLKKVDGRLPTALIDKIAFRLAKLIHATYIAGTKTSLRTSAELQSSKARAGKKRLTDQRWQIIRRAIVWVCREKRLKLIASDAFAESIRTDVVDAARRFGLSDLRRGTSARSLERHLAALLKDREVLNAILQEWEFQDLRRD